MLIPSSWIVLGAIANEKWIDPSALKEFGPEMQFRYHMSLARVESKMLKGTFDHDT